MSSKNVSVQNEIGKLLKMNMTTTNKKHEINSLEMNLTDKQENRIYSLEYGIVALLIMKGKMTLWSKIKKKERKMLKTNELSWNRTKIDCIQLNYIRKWLIVIREYNRHSKKSSA